MALAAQSEANDNSQNFQPVVPQSGDVGEFKTDHRRLIRLNELETAVSLFPQTGKVLEIGAGAGWQAKKLAEEGYDVTAIDIEACNYISVREWPVLDYDGHNIPLPDSSIDVIFSSNVLEHIPHIEEFQKEMQRVLRPGGVAIHIMPSASWRFWTLLSFYISRVQQVLRKNKPVSKKTHRHQNDDEGTNATKQGSLLRKAFPTTHGVRGNPVTEMYYFSRFFWSGVFKRNGWSLERIVPNRLFYTGYRVTAESLPIESRRQLSSFLGSSCLIYILRKKK